MRRARIYRQSEQRKSGYEELNMRVVIAIDESPYSKDVVSAVAKRSWPADTEFKILTVLEPIEDLDGDFEELICQTEEKRKKQCQKLCEKIRQRLEVQVPGSIIHFELRNGRPHCEIIDAATEWSADKILLGAHGKDACPHLLLGSVSRAVATHAPCTVEIVRPRRKKADKGHSTKSETEMIEAIASK